MTENTTQAAEAASGLNAELGIELRDLIHKVRPFITAQSGSGKYKVVLELNNSNDMHDLHKQLLLFIKG